MVHHQILAPHGRIRLTVKNGMLMVDAHGVGEIVLLSTETNHLANQIHDVPGQLLTARVFEHTTNHRASHIVDVRGAIAGEIVQDFEMR